MTRINTNVSSIVAQQHLVRTNSQLQTSLTRLSTGLRINTGKDDPAGLIASEALRSDITSINKAISNTNRAVQVIATADSALGQVSTLLNNVRGLIVEAANRGAISPDEIAANQLQIDSSLEAINRIAQTTSFQGRKLLDGSLDFVSNLSTIPSVTDYQITQANLGISSNPNVQIEVEISEPATQAELTSSGAEEFNANLTLAFDVRSDSVLTDISVQANGITAPVTITFAQDAGLGDGEVAASFNATTNTITVSGNETVAGTITREDVADAINALAQFNAVAGTPGAAAGNFTGPGTVPGDATISGPSIEITANAVGNDFNNIDVVFQAGAATNAAYDANSRTLTITYVPGTDNFAAIATAIDNLADFDATATNGALVSNAGDVATEGSTGYTGGGVLMGAVVFEVIGTLGSDTLKFEAGTTMQQMAAAINLLSDATGVTATVEADNSLTFQSSDYGSKSVVAINIISEDPTGTFGDSLSTIRDNGTDINAKINGIPANGNGNSFSVSTTALMVSLTVDPDQLVSNFSFNITGGGALFQLGGDVVTNQQARMGITSLSTGTLGGVHGRLYELASGQAKALDNDIHGAGLIIDEVINKITSLRGRLGAFQATTLEGNLVSLGDTISNLTEAESSIRDTDFASESARLTRAQILVQSGTSVLGIANQNPQSVLSLLR